MWPKLVTPVLDALDDEAGCNDNDYWSSSQRPLACLVFVLPLVVFYELGVLSLQNHANDSLRNGADFWMRSWLHPMGDAAPAVLPLLVIGGLLGWHLLRRHPWRVEGSTLLGMTSESVLFGCLLIVLGQMHDLAFHGGASAGASSPVVTPNPEGSSEIAPWRLAVSYVGAGVYEEALFRLLLLPCLFGFFRFAWWPRRQALWGAALGSSLAFSLAHYIGPGGDVFDPFSFAFRTSAGLLFAGLFVYRGFGVAAGTHAVYDLLVGVVLPS